MMYVINITVIASAHKFYLKPLEDEIVVRSLLSGVMSEIPPSDFLRSRLKTTIVLYPGEGRNNKFINLLP